MAEVDPKTLGIVMEGAQLAHSMPYIDEQLGKMEALVKRRVFNAIADGALTPEMALNAWFELHSYAMLNRRLDQKVQFATSNRQKVDHSLPDPASKVDKTPDKA